MLVDAGRCGERTVRHHKARHEQRGDHDQQDRPHDPAEHGGQTVRMLGHHKREGEEHHGIGELRPWARATGQKRHDRHLERGRRRAWNREQRADREHDRHAEDE